MSVLCSGAEISVSGPDFNGIERRLIVYRRPFGLAASEALATQHYRRQFESCHRSPFDCHRPNVSELEPARALPRYHGATSVTDERMNVAGSLFSGLNMRCTSTPPCLLSRQKKAMSSVPHRERSHFTHCNRRPVACGLAVDDAGIRTRACLCAYCGTNNVLPA